MNTKAELAGHPHIPSYKKIPAMKFHDKKAKMEAIFGVGASKFIDETPIAGLFGGIDIVGFDDWMKTKHADYNDDNESLHSFVERNYGADVASWIVENLDAVM